MPGLIRAATLASMDRLWRLGYRLAYRGLRLSWWLRRPAASGAGVALRHGRRLLLVRSSYRPELDLPAGGIGRDETPRAAALRELREETGVAVPPDAVTLLGTFRFVEAYRDVTLIVFEARLDDAPAPAPDGREIVWAGWVDPATLPRQQLGQALRLYLEWAAGVPVGDGAG